MVQLMCLLVPQVLANEWGPGKVKRSQNRPLRQEGVSNQKVRHHTKYKGLEVKLASLTPTSASCWQ